MNKVKCFDFDSLADALQGECPEILFALLHGSTAQSGIINPGSDIDVAFYLDRPLDLELYCKISGVITNSINDVAEADIGVLNEADPIYRFEALKGRLLFARDKELYYRFFSFSCREYEAQMIDYEIQHKYRLEYRRSA